MSGASGSVSRANDGKIAHLARSGNDLPQGAGEHDTVQLTPPLAPSLATVAENDAVAPSCTVAEMAERFTVTAGTVITTVSDLVESLAEVAVRFAVSTPAWEAGGVYVVGFPLAVDVGDTLPQGGVAHDTLQLTPLFAESLVTVAVNCAVAPTSTVAIALGSDTLIGGGGGGGGVLPPLQPEKAKGNIAQSSNAKGDTRLLDFMANLPPDSSRVLPVPCLVASSGSAS